MTRQIDYVCPHCGEGEGALEALLTCRWSTSDQEWVVADGMEGDEAVYCGDCFKENVIPKQVDI